MKYLAILLLTTAIAHADPTAKAEAQRHIDKASELHKDGKFKLALDELTAAYALTPEPGLLYAIGQIHVKLGQCGLAIGFYERFIATKPDPDAAAAAREAIAACKSGEVPPPPVEPPPVAPPVAPPPVANPPPPSQPESTVWYRDVIGDALVGGGIFFVAASALTYHAATGKLDDADQAKSYTAQHDLVDQAHGDRTYAIVLAGMGAALIGVGIFHYVHHGDAARAPQIGLAPTPGGAFASFAARF